MWKLARNWAEEIWSFRKHENRVKVERKKSSINVDKEHFHWLKSVWYLLRWFESEEGKSTIMQAALMLRSKQRLARNKMRRQRMGIKGECLPSDKSTKEIPPYPQFPPESWVGSFLDSPPKVFKCLHHYRTIWVRSFQLVLIKAFHVPLNPFAISTHFSPLESTEP